MGEQASNTRQGGNSNSNKQANQARKICRWIIYERTRIRRTTEPEQWLKEQWKSHPLAKNNAEKGTTC